MPTDETLVEVYPMDLGAFYMLDANGKQLSKEVVQDIFNAPCWKTYRVSNSGRFTYSDMRTGKTKEYKIVIVNRGVLNL